MNDLAPLLLLWLASRARGGGGGGSRPAWPSAISPPPPPPSSPLPPAAPGAAAPPSDVPGAFADAVTARDKVVDELKKARKESKLADSIAKTVQQQQRGTKRLKPIVVTAKPKPDFLNWNPEMDVSVADVQKLANRHGARIKQDGLYGPITAAAWQALARKRGLQPNIARLSSKIARVATKTFTTLNSPHVP